MMVKVLKQSLYFPQVEWLVLPDYTVSSHFPAFVFGLLYMWKPSLLFSAS